VEDFGSVPVVRDGSPLAMRRVPEAPSERPPSLERRSPGGPGPSGRRRPLIVAIGGSTRSDSPTMRALGAITRMLAQAGAETVMLGLAELDLPPYAPDGNERVPGARRLLGEVSRADGLVIAAPDYLGGTTGELINALDYLWELRDAPRPCLEARPVGLVTCEEGPGAGGALAVLRARVHALGGWPTPLGIALTKHESGAIDPYGAIGSPAINERFGMLTDQIIGFTYAWSHLI
jgi:FMN reductase